MSDVVDRGFIEIHTYPITMLLKVLPIIPSCHFSRTMPPWEQEIIYDLANAFDIPVDSPSISYDEAMKLKGEIFSKLGQEFNRYVDLGPDRYDLLEQELLGDDADEE